MVLEFTTEQKRQRERFALFSHEHIAPHTAQHDRGRAISRDIIQSVAAAGLLGSSLPRVWGGAGLDMISYGLLHEEVGKVCSSTRSIITVHDMVAQAILKWGSDEQRRKWLPMLAKGTALGALAVSEPNVGSDAKGVETTARYECDGYKLSGTKKWVTAGQVADVFLVLAKCEQEPTAFLVDRTQPGVSVSALPAIVGQRGSMLAKINLEDCLISPSMRLGEVGLGTSVVLGTALGLGRYSVAWGCVGIMQACLEACVEYTRIRQQFGRPLIRHQLIQQMLSGMITNVQAARLLCCRAGYLKDRRDPNEVPATIVCKYFAAKAAAQVASDAVQIHGANGCSEDYCVERHFRDAKVMEIIEGSNQIHETIICQFPELIWDPQ